MNARSNATAGRIGNDPFAMVPHRRHLIDWHLVQRMACAEDVLMKALIDSLIISMVIIVFFIIVVEELDSFGLLLHSANYHKY